MEVPFIAIAYASTNAANTTIEHRIANSCWRSLMPGRRFLRMFSTKLVEGASSVADDVLLMAETSAPKKRICITSGILVMMKVGSRR